VIDFDIVNDTEDLKLLLRDLEVPAPLAQGWCQTKALLVQRFDAVSMEHKRRGLRAIVDPELLSATRSLLTAMQGYGIFVVPNGELESWQPAPGIEPTSNKKLWLMNAFAALGDDPVAAGYAHPADDDVWSFVRSISAWINYPNREGV
jgi:hypothetical protein